MRPPAPGDPPALWTVDAARHAAPAALAAPAVLDDEERRRAAGFRREHDRATYVVAHVALRMLLGAQLGLAPQCVTLVREACPLCRKAHGRPAVAEGRTHFSLAHSGRLVLLAFAAEPVGADAEEVPSARAAAEIAGVLHPREAAELGGLPAAERPRACARIWARKEAYLKGIGTGLARDPTLDYLGAAPGPVEVARWQVVDVDVPPGFAAAVASPSGKPGARPRPRPDRKGR
ncbi:4'-phosphopantetheinyl transferase superfamily protein [Streptomyces sp. NBC_01808]|uniref:4'-phosphopantetheinyl transferase family protein n=1 Tax=Streptomyces sp. NBC_01808 TaxID=2975947 RepID=UPI002DDC52AF|nr:4'-phosphopantetheinyl transferase superfamily protein [Streptomyces sp. NBC_01808]WSA38348.1 4'-phosphopantetheinyl transferase superfamily protein [Streptomyces sp. NBC_01808]